MIEAYRGPFRMKFSTLFVAWIGLILLAPAAADNGGFCLQHTGPQDKPLPALCFAHDKQSSDSSEDEDYLIAIQISDVRAVEELAKNYDNASCRGEYGSYATKDGQSPKVVICRKDMKRFLEKIKSYTDTLKGESIQEFMSRI